MNMTQTLSIISINSSAAQDCDRPTTPLAVHLHFVPNETPRATNLPEVRRQEMPDYQSAAARRIAPTLEYMKAHLDQPVTIAALSAMVELSQSSFFELFRTATQATPLQWFIRVRMRRASELLVQTRLPIKQVAKHVGYEDPLYFSRAFKSVCGLPPSEFRARNKPEATTDAAA